MKTEHDLEKEMIDEYHDRVNGTMGLFFVIFLASLGGVVLVALVGYGVNALINLIIK